MVVPKGVSIKWSRSAMSAERRGQSGTSRGHQAGEVAQAKASRCEWVHSHPSQPASESAFRAQVPFGDNLPVPQIKLWFSSFLCGLKNLFCPSGELLLILKAQLTHHWLFAILPDICVLTWENQLLPFLPCLLLRSYPEHHYRIFNLTFWCCLSWIFSFTNSLKFRAAYLLHA
jgi:hypothetical protein